MSQPFLHEIIAGVLREAGRPMTRTEIAGKIAAGTLWFRPGDKLPPPASQISLRVKNHPNLFEKDGNLIRLKLETALTDRMFRLT